VSVLRVTSTYAELSDKVNEATFKQLNPNPSTNPIHNPQSYT